MFSIETQSRERRLKIAGMIFLGSFLLSFLPSFLTPLYSRGEARESVVATDMVNQQNYILPLRNGTSIPSKPPLFHWVALAASNVIGELDAPAMRFPSSFAASLLLAAFFLVLAPIYGTKTSGLSVLILGSSVLWMSYSASARVDMVFTLGLNLSLFVGWRIVKCTVDGFKIAPVNFLMLACALALAVLAKGPAGLLLPLAACGFWVLANAVTERRNIFRTLPWIGILGSVALGLALAAVWYFLAYQEGGKSFLDVHLMRENLARLTGDNKYLTGHRHGVFYVVGQLLVGFSPWGLFLPLVFWSLWRERRSLFLSADPILGLNVAWVITLLAAVCVSSSKRGVYLLPLYPSLAFLTARMLIQGNLSIDRVARVLRRLVGIEFFVLKLFFPMFVIGSVLIFKLLPLEPTSIVLNPPARLVFESLYPALQAVLPVMLITGMAATVLQFRACAAWGRHHLVWASVYLAAAALVMTAGGAFGVHPVIAQNLSPKGFIESLRKLGCENLYLYKVEHYPSIFYAGAAIPVVQTGGEFPARAGNCLLAQRTDAILLSQDDPRFVSIAESKLPVVYGKNFLTALVLHEN